MRNPHPEGGPNMIDTESTSQDPRLNTSVMPLILTGVIAISFVGFFVGIHANAQRDDPLVEVGPAGTTGQLHFDGVMPSVAYFEMDGRKHGPNAEFSSSLDRLHPPSDAMLHQLDQADARVVSLAEREERRAYNGAPPIIPHPIDQLTATSCLLCHGEGKRIGDRIAHKMPHQNYASCTQCHVEQVNDEGLIAVNSFEGVAAPTQGRRAWNGAPPIIPHTLNMRSDCLSCHGPNGRPSLRTTHPERTSCLQCHAPSAGLNQSPSRGLNAFLKNSVSNPG